MKLNIGAGDFPLPGYTPIDRKFGSEAYPLNYADGSVDEVRASHVLEHFGWKDVPAVLLEWVRVLKPGGIIKIAVPNLKWIAANIDNPMARFYTMGGQTDENDFHKSTFTPESLTELLQAVGLENITTWRSEVQDCASLPVSLNLQGRKPVSGVAKYDDGKDRTKIAAVISMPRLAFTDNMFSAMSVFGPLQIPFTKVTGAFWGQCLTRGIEKHLKDGTEWIVSVDYDTLFDMQIFTKLCQLMAEHPEADCIAPVQIKRDETLALMTIEDDNGKRLSEVDFSVFRKPLTRIATAHFGLTLFRVSALKRMPKPWFLAVPNEAGEWNEGRTDEDIYFWQRWKECGNTLYLANGVGIGHMQLVATWPDQHYQPHHQLMGDYYAKGRPQFPSTSGGERSVKAAPAVAGGGVA